MMLTRIAGGRVIDPANQRDALGDVWIRDGRIVDVPNARADATYDATGKIVMAGAIDIHSHIAGWNVNTARLLLPEYHSAAMARPSET
jgi:formylmethanofuran dehydrogenase subunit A